jgi:NAD(P)-dependent dehydrogenase (short-subunit alcohol dehydrogenase family)
MPAEKRRSDVGLVDGKAGLVTGAAGGLGRATAVLFGAEGGSVIVSDLESQREAAEETVSLVEEAGGRASFVAADVTAEEDQQKLVEACVAAYGSLDFAHNNAGVDLQARTEETTVEQWDATLGVNLKGVWLGIKHQLAQMRKQRSGSIVNTGSGTVILAVTDMAAYTASKRAVVGLTQVAALEAGDDGIRVNCVCPGVMRTPMLEDIDPEQAAALTSLQAIKQVIEPSEVAEAVVWLASDRASLVTGSTLVADRGITAGLAPARTHG